MWPWANWSSVLSLHDSAPSRVFVHEVLTRCVRLSYWEKIKSTVPEEFHILLPDTPTPAYRFSERNNPYTEAERQGLERDKRAYVDTAARLLHVIRERREPGTVMIWLDHNVTPVLGADARLKLFVPCFLEAGSKSFAHTNSLLDRYKTVLLNLNVDGPSQV
jgi:nuclear cap-binding protein subunit 1